MCVQKVAGASTDRMERQRVKLAPPGRGSNAFVLVSHSRPAVCASGRRGAGRSRRTSSWSGSSARRGGLEEARLVNLPRHVLSWRYLHAVRDSTHDQASLQLHEFRNKLTAAGAPSAPDRPDLPHAVAVAVLQISQDKKLFSLR